MVGPAAAAELGSPAAFIYPGQGPWFGPALLGLAPDLAQQEIVAPKTRSASIELPPHRFRAHRRAGAGAWRKPELIGGGMRHRPPSLRVVSPMLDVRNLEHLAGLHVA